MWKLVIFFAVAGGCMLHSVIGSAVNLSISIDPDVVDTLKEVHDGKYSYVTMKIQDKKVVVLDKGAPFQDGFDQEENERVFNEMKAKVGDEPRFIVFDFRTTRANGAITQKLHQIAFITW